MEKRKGVVSFAGKEITLLGKEIKVGDKAPEFVAVNTDLSLFSLKDTAGLIRVISVAPSLDTSVCDMQTRWFIEWAGKIKDLTVLAISADLPFALKRYCGAKEISNVRTISDHKDLDFGLKYGFAIEELRLLARGTIVIDHNDVVRHVEYVPNIGDQPNYEAVMEIVNQYL